MRDPKRVSEQVRSMGERMLELAEMIASHGRPLTSEEEQLTRIAEVPGLQEAFNVSLTGFLIGQVEEPFENAAMMYAQMVK